MAWARFCAFQYKRGAGGGSQLQDEQRSNGGQMGRARAKHLLAEILRPAYGGPHYDNIRAGRRVSGYEKGGLEPPFSVFRRTFGV